MIQVGQIPTYLYICSCFIGDLHDKFTLFSIGWVHQMVKNIKIHSCTQVIDIRHKYVLLPLSNQSIQQARIIETGIDVTMPWGIPCLCTLS